MDFKAALGRLRQMRADFTPRFCLFLHPTRLNTQWADVLANRYGSDAVPIAGANCRGDLARPGHGRFGTPGGWPPSDTGSERNLGAIFPSLGRAQPCVHCRCRVQCWPSGRDQPSCGSRARRETAHYRRSEAVRHETGVPVAVFVQKRIPKTHPAPTTRFGRTLPFNTQLAASWLAVVTVPLAVVPWALVHVMAFDRVTEGCVGPFGWLPVLLGFPLTSAAFQSGSSPATGGTPRPARLRIRFALIASPRSPRSRKYSPVRSADNFSATATLMN
jgi:hypothetical protein